jgi:asparagine synthase (glutamine-hydrolysing)
VNIAPFVALVMDRDRPRSDRIDHFVEVSCRSHGLVPLVQRERLLVLGAPEAPHIVIADGAGLVWGHLFDRHGGERRQTLAGTTDLGGGAKEFLRRYWGGYAALCATADGMTVLRDPSGVVPCYHAQVDGVQILTSRPQLLVEAGLMRAEIDWTIVVQGLAYRDLRPTRTALRGISELQPGMAARLTPGRIDTNCAWSPWQFTGPESELADRTAAIGAVGETARMCIAAWGRAFQRPIAEISGGLDSAIVAAGLKLAGCMPACLTFEPAQGDPDETPYARAIADHLGVPLEAVPLRITDIDLMRSQAYQLPRPSARNFAQALDRPNRELAAKIGADAFFSGGGGDNVFCHIQSTAPVIDRFRRQGLGRGLFETIDHVAQLAHCSSWNVARVAARRMIRGAGAERWPSNTRYLSPQALDRLPFPDGHPWVDAPPDALPGKRDHVTALIAIQNHLDGLERIGVAPIISPLLSQPLMEVCLAIPSWLWCDGGNNRAMARAAFRDVLPASVIARRSKGAFDAFAGQLLDANRALLREMLLDGLLARERLVDIDAIERDLGPTLPASDAIVRLLSLADVEAWSRTWQGDVSFGAPASRS